MPLKIVRNDITKMNTEAIVNTANVLPLVGEGCDFAVYMAAGYDALLEYRTSNIGQVKEGDVFLTPGFQLPAKYIIHAVSPLYLDGEEGEETLLRSCYQKSLELAKAKGIKSIAFPLISTGSFGYPKEEGMRIAVDEISQFLLQNQMDVRLVVFDEVSTTLGKNLFDELEAYIDQNYVQKKAGFEYKNPEPFLRGLASSLHLNVGRNALPESARCSEPCLPSENISKEEDFTDYGELKASSMCFDSDEASSLDEEDALLELDQKLEERLSHVTDTFSEYLLYLISQKGMKNADVYNRAVVDKRLFSKIKKNKDYHPEKIKALCLCVGAKLSLDETKDLLQRAGYALSPCDLTDIIFSFYIEHEHYDVIDIDIQLEEHGLPCIIT